MNEDKASRYHRLRRRASCVGAGLGAAALAALLVSGASAWMRDVAADWGGGWLAATTVFYCVMLAVVSEAVQLPVSFYQQLTLERRYGLSTQTTGGWLLDHAKGGAIGLAFGVGAALAVVIFLAWSPERWWIAAAICFPLVLVGLARVTPVLLLPLFYGIKPLERESLAERLLVLARRAGTPAVGVYEWQLSDRTRKANAVLAGLGRTRRILLSDTLLAEHSDDEIEVIFAHELAHHAHRDIWAGILLESALLALSLYAADYVLSASVGPLGLAGKSDVAGLPVLLLTIGAVSVAARPLANAVSRLHERRADRFALEMTEDVESFVTAMRRLAAQNLAEEHPSRAVEWLFYTHPPMSSRIAAAQGWAAARTGHATKASRSA